MRKVLIVDDNKLERAVLSNIISGKYEVLEAGDGAEMLKIIQREGADISAVMLDIIMPEMDGFQALERLRSNSLWRQIPVIVTTALTDEKTQVRALSLGANGYATKPYNARLLQYTLENAVSLSEQSALLNAYRKDTLTGLLNRESFIQAAESLIHSKEPGYYMLSCFDIENFKIINEQYGTDKGDAVLRSTAECIHSCIERITGICCRFTSDKFAMLYPASYNDSEILAENHQLAANPRCINRRMKIRIGRYLVDDLTISVSAMIDRATMAEESIKGRYDTYIQEYNSSMLESVIREQWIVNAMDEALKAGEFEPWYQPQYNHSTGALIGAEALVRWRHEGRLISPAEFIPVFERNGFIYEMDQYIWEQVCRQLRQWLDAGKRPLPVSVNISRRDLFHAHFVEVFTQIINKYKIPYDFIRLEVTESAFAEHTKTIINRVDELINLGFTVEIDDFGSGYSSLNTLKDVSASILKLDMRFFENTVNTQRSGNIIEAVVRMAKWLGMAIIAEGVEDKSQADYLKSIGCQYIQGYYYARPMPISEYEAIFENKDKEDELAGLLTDEAWNNNEFWNPRSMESLIFNSYIGGACIFEYHMGKVELLRVNDRYAQELGKFYIKGMHLEEQDPIRFFDDENKRIMFDNIRNAIETARESSCELMLKDEARMPGHIEYIRSTVRVIARADERYLFYCVVLNMTEQRETEKKEAESARRLETVLNSIKYGVAATATDGRTGLVLANERFFAMLGYTREQFITENRNEYDFLHPDDSGQILSILQSSEEGEHELFYRLVCRDGSVRSVCNRTSVTEIPGIEHPVRLSVYSECAG